MAIDFDKMKTKLDKLQNKGSQDSNFWRPEDGEQTIRIVPTSDGDPFKDFWFHYNVGKNPGFLSPKRNFGEADPLDSFVRELFDEGTEDSVKMAKNLMARPHDSSRPLLYEVKKTRVSVFGDTERWLMKSC